ncbi:saccharopine dehydrogenase [Micromonospora matsumotoense]|uniref:saccharopine dehydrogenase n=1 Tax=Micromonospora matsumotoense TaxID=121616 RepID=UPI0034222653
MNNTVRLWVRHETRSTERRTPVTPDDARRLVGAGLDVTIEESPQRTFPLREYLDAGCTGAPAGSWPDAPPDTVVVGLKELPDQPAVLTHRHVYFGHAYKGQRGAPELLRRFSAGSGALLDLEYLVDDDGRRLAAFGYWAGYLGAALGVLHLAGELDVPLAPLRRSDLDERLRRSTKTGEPPRALVIGALGRCGRGARSALAVAGITPTCWDMAETANLDRATLLDHDLLVNTVLSTGPVEPFLTVADIDRPDRRLALVVDVTCDVGSPYNTLPIYDRTSTWDHPAIRLRTAEPVLDVIAVDNLPSLLPHEASVAFSADLLPHLLSLADPTAATWRRCERVYREACRTYGIGVEEVDG